MPTTTFLNPADFKNDTSNSAVNHHLSELIAQTKEDWRIQETVFLGRRRFLFFREKSYSLFTCYVQVAGMEYQIINFRVKSTGSINHEVPADIMVNWLMGVCAGIGIAKRAFVKTGAAGNIDPNHTLARVIDYVKGSSILA